MNPFFFFFLRMRTAILRAFFSEARLRISSEFSDSWLSECCSDRIGSDRIGSDRLGSDLMGLLVAARERHSKHRFQLSLLLTLERRRKRRFQLSLLLTVERGRMRLSLLIASRERRCKRRRKCRLQLSLLSAV
jgi:hypothetical protein